MSTPHQPNRRNPGVAQGQRVRGGRWYFILTVLSVGFLAAIPFWHAARRLNRPGVRRLAVIYAVADIYLWILMILTPPDNPDGSSGNEALSTLGGFSMFVIMIVACIQLRSLRRQAYSQARFAEAPYPITPQPVDPVMAQALHARARREEARRLVVDDPALARELGIGRPELRRGYDDGGLVDINTAPAEVIAGVCQIDRSVADSIVAGRAARGGGYFNVGELLVDVGLPPHLQDQVRERAVFSSFDTSDAPFAAPPLSLQKQPPVGRPRPGPRPT